MNKIVKKTIVILLGISLLAFIAVQVFGMYSQYNIETYEYEVTKTYPDFEIRKYKASLFTSVELESDTYKNASGEGFSVLAGYIFGDNERKESIAMTSPVTMSLDDSMTMMFLVPSKFSKETLPKPNQSQIEFTEVPAKTVAAISFGGWANDEKINRYKEELKSALDAQEIAYTTQFFFLGYNAPFEVFNRKNEIIVELKDAVEAP